MNHDVASARPLVAAALVGALIQLLASLRLAVASLSQLQSAATEGSSWYVLGIAVSAIGFGFVWRLRRRPLLAVGLLVLWQALVLWPLSARTSLLGLAFHGEAIAHHFVAVLAAMICVLVPLHLASARQLGAKRFVPLVQGSVGVALLLAAHLLPDTTVTPTYQLAQVGAAALLTTAVTCAVVLRRSIRDRWAGVAVAAFFVVLVVRVALAGTGGLAGAPIPPQGIFALLAAACVAAGLGQVLLRPRLELPLMLFVNVASALAVAYLYWVYRRHYGSFEDSVGGLAQSLLGFSPPYPEYVALWKIWIVMLALFFLLNTIYSTLLSEQDRDRGFALGLMMTGGLGLTSPQLVLMVGASLLVLLATLTREPAKGRTAEPPDMSPVDLLATLTEGMSLPAPLVLDDSDGSVVAVRGAINNTPIDIRVRPHRKHTWELTIQAGLPGRGRPHLELIPDRGDRGQRPDHELGRTHRVKGSIRELEELDTLLDALTPFSTARIRLWAAGTTIDLGADLSALDPPALSQLLRALARR